MKPDLDLTRDQNMVSKWKSGDISAKGAQATEVTHPGLGPPQATQWEEIGQGGAMLQLGHTSNSCFFGTMSRTDFILLVLTLHEATARV